MATLSEKFRRALEGRVTVGEYTFIFRRPLWEEAQRIAGPQAAERIVSHVIGWEGVRELDLIPGGDPHPAPFEAEACRLWLFDRPDLAAAVSKAILDAYSAHIARLEEIAKN